MTKTDAKKLFSFSSTRNRRIIENALKDHANENETSQSVIIEQTLIDRFLPANPQARLIAEELYDGKTLGESYVAAMRCAGVLLDPAKTTPLVHAFLENISMLQPTFTGKEPQFERILFHLPPISTYIQENDEFFRNFNLTEELRQWPHLTPIMHCVGPIVTHWDHFHKSGYARTVLEACTEIAAPNIIDNPKTRNRFVDALNCW